MLWILAFCLQFTEARTAWRRLEDQPAIMDVKRFLRGRKPIAVVTGPGAAEFADRLVAHTRDVIVPVDSPFWYEAVDPELLRETRVNVVVQRVGSRTDQDMLLNMLRRYQAQKFKMRLILVMEPQVRIEWAVRREARLIELEPGCARELGTRYDGWYQLDLFD